MPQAGACDTCHQRRQWLPRSSCPLDGSQGHAMPECSRLAAAMGKTSCGSDHTSLPSGQCRSHCQSLPSRHPPPKWSSKWAKEGDFEQISPSRARIQAIYTQTGPLSEDRQPAPSCLCTHMHGACAGTSNITVAPGFDP